MIIVQKYFDTYHYNVWSIRDTKNLKWATQKTLLLSIILDG